MADRLADATQTGVDDLGYVSKSVTMTAKEVSPSRYNLGPDPDTNIYNEFSPDNTVAGWFQAQGFGIDPIIYPPCLKVGMEPINMVSTEPTSLISSPRMVFPTRSRRERSRRLYPKEGGGGWWPHRSSTTTV